MNIIQSSKSNNNIINTEKFFIPPTSIDNLILTKIKNKTTIDDFNIKVALKRINEYEYEISYKELYNTLFNNLITNRKDDENKSENSKKIFQLHSSIFYFSKFTNCQFINRMSFMSNDSIIFSFNNIKKNEIPLGFNFWCSSPATYCFTTIKFYTNYAISDIMFQTKIIYCDIHEYTKIACEPNISKTIDGKNVLCNDGKLCLIEDKNIKDISEEIKTNLSIPFVLHPNKAYVTIWGNSLNEIRQLFKNRTQYIKEIDSSENDNYFEYSIPWIEFLIHDDNIEELLFYDNSVLYFKRSNIEYILPKQLINTYTEKVNKITKDIYLWKLNYSDIKSSNEKKYEKKYEEIEREIKKTEEELLHDIYELRKNEEIYEKSQFIEQYDKTNETKKLEKIDISKKYRSCAPPIYSVLLFYNNKSVDCIEMNSLDIIDKYKNIMDEKTIERINKWE